MSHYSVAALKSGKQKAMLWKTGDKYVQGCWSFNQGLGKYRGGAALPRIFACPLLSECDIANMQVYFCG